MMAAPRSALLQVQNFGYALFCTNGSATEKYYAEYLYVIKGVTIIKSVQRR